MGLPNTRYPRPLLLALATCAAFAGCFAHNTAGGGGGLHFAESANYVKPLSTRAEVDVQAWIAGVEQRAAGDQGAR